MLRSQGIKKIDLDNYPQSYNVTLKISEVKSYRYVKANDILSTIRNNKNQKTAMPETNNFPC